MATSGHDQTEELASDLASSLERTSLLAHDLVTRLAAEQEARRRAEDQIRTLRDAVLLVLTHGRDLDEVLDALDSWTRDLLAADASSVHLFDPTVGEFLTRRACALARPGTPWAEVGARFHLGEPVAAAFRAGRLVVFEDFRADPRIAASSKAALPTVEAALAVPLRLGSELVGGLFALWEHPRAFDAQEQATAEALGAYAAVAVLSARTREGVVRTARLEGAVLTARRVAHELNNALGLIVGFAELLPGLTGADFDEALRDVAEEARRAAAVVTRLQRLVRVEETRIDGGAMLDLDGSIEP